MSGFYKPNVRPYGEYFAKSQAITTTATTGNQAANNPSRIENAQGGTSILVCTPKDGSLTLVSGASVTLSVRHSDNTSTGFALLGTGVYVPPSGGVTLGSDEMLIEFVLPGNAKPYIKVEIHAVNTAPTGAVDIFPSYISRPPAR